MITLRSASALLPACIILLIRPASGTIRHVPADYGTIQLAVDAAAAEDTVEVACGNYYEHAIVIPQSVLLRSATGLSGCVVVDAQQQGPVFAAPLAATTIQGITIRGGSAQAGAGISCLFALPLTLERCLFENNAATQRGGGLLCLQSVVVATDCRFEGNTATAGGGVFLEEATATFIGCSFLGNSAGGDSQDGGGAVAGQIMASAEFDGCVFSQNSAPYGGALHCRVESHATLRHCVISGNTASYGGGLYSPAYLIGTFTIESTAITGNLATVSGGGASVYGSTFRNSTIAGNAAPVGGGAAARGTCTFENSVLWGNCATDGAQLYVNAQFPASRARFSCSVVDTSAGWLATGLGSGGVVEWIATNRFEDPLFCVPLACDEQPASEGDYSVAANSPCLPENSGTCGPIGCYGPGSCTTGTSPLTWGGIKARFR